MWVFIIKSYVLELRKLTESFVIFKVLSAQVKENKALVIIRVRFMQIRELPLFTFIFSTRRAKNLSFWLT